MKEWLTLDETATHLSGILGEKLDSKDVLRLCLDRKLTLSVYFVEPVYARKGNLVSIDDVDTPIFDRAEVERHKSRHWLALLWSRGPKPIGNFKLDKIPEDIKAGLINGTLFAGGGWPKHFNYLSKYAVEFRDSPDDTVFILVNIWDLPLSGVERHLIEAMALLESKLPAAKCQLPGGFANGVLVERDSGDMIFELMDSKLRNPVKLHGGIYYEDSGEPVSDFSPAYKLPESAILAIRTDALTSFAQKLANEEREEKESEEGLAESRRVDAASMTALPPEEGPGTKERSTLLTIIEALAKRAKIDTSRPSQAGKAIEELTSLIGASVPSRTIEHHLRRIPEALARRRSD